MSQENCKARVCFGRGYAGSPRTGWSWELVREWLRGGLHGRVVRLMVLCGLAVVANVLHGLNAVRFDLRLFSGHVQRIAHYQGQSIGTGAFNVLHPNTRRELVDWKNGRPGWRESYLLENHLRRLEEDMETRYINETTLVLYWSPNMNIWNAKVHVDGVDRECNIPCKWTTNKSRVSEATGIAAMLDKAHLTETLPSTVDTRKTPILGITWENNMQKRSSRRSFRSWLGPDSLPREQLGILQDKFPYNLVASHELDSHIPVVYPEILNFFNSYSRSALQDLERQAQQRAQRLFLAISNCVAEIVPNRLSFALRLSSAAKLPIVSIGTCLGNITHAENKRLGRSYRGSKAHIEEMGRSLFTLVAENSYGIDYVTEKIFFALQSGTVPIYLGAPNIRSFLPHPQAAIVVADYESMEELGQYLILLKTDVKSLVAKHQAPWRTLSKNQFPLHFLNLLKLVMTRRATGKMSFACKVCNCFRGKLGCDLG